MSLLAHARALESIIRDVVREAIMPRYLTAVRQHKADGSLMTEADLAAQYLLEERLPMLLPAPVIGEEMDESEQVATWQQGQDGLWCIDPIDGTTNFANGIPLFGVSVAYLVDNATQFGVVYNPITDEAFYAARGEGAWLNGIRLPLRHPATRLNDAVAGVDFKRIPAKLSSHMVARPPFFSQRNFGSSALEWCFVAAARLDIYLHGGQAVWDYAAGRLLVEEVGGKFCTLEGDALIADPIAKRSVCIAASPGLHAEWHNWICSHLD